MFDEQNALDLARLWVARKDGDLTVDQNVEQSLVLMNFTAPPSVQWIFVVAATGMAKSDETLGAIAAGPVEHLLGKWGDDFIDRVEVEAKRSPRFARMLTGVWRHTMSEAVWLRVEALSADAIAAGNELE